MKSILKILFLKYYCMDYLEILKKISTHYNIPYDELERVVHMDSPDLQKIPENKTIILPFCGKIISENCKGILYNHGLYTQCEKKEINESLCKSCSKLKYGRIEDRLNFKIGEFVTKDGRKEISYKKFMKKMNYSTQEVIRELNQQKLEFKLLNKMDNTTANTNTNTAQSEKRGRGRPKKYKVEAASILEIESESEEEIEVIKVKIGDKEYLKTEEEVLLDPKSYEIVGVYKNGKIDKL